MTKLLKYSNLSKKWKNDQKFKKAYHDLEWESQIIDLFIQKRIQQNLTQSQLAQKLGIKQPVISKFENGNFNPTVKFLKSLASALDAKLQIKFIAKR